MARSCLFYRHEKIIIFRLMVKCKMKNKEKKRAVPLPSSHRMTHAIPGPNYFISGQLYAVKKSPVERTKEEKISPTLLYWVTRLT